MVNGICSGKCDDERINDMVSIAIDGPSGAGKSTISRKAAERFGLIYVDTGAMYRTIGLAAHRRGIDTRDRQSVISLLPEIKLEMKYNGQGEQRMYLWGEDVSAEIRLPEISMCASNVSAIPEVRAFLTDTQRSMAEKHNVIMDGRDIGTVILPNARLKIFLTADVRSRAERRLRELAAKGMTVGFDEVLTDMIKRDEQDTLRAAAPLRPADDAVLLDTSSLSFGESVDAVCGLIAERTGLRARE